MIGIGTFWGILRPNKSSKKQSCCVPPLLCDSDVPVKPGPQYCVTCSSHTHSRAPYYSLCCALLRCAHSLARSLVYSLAFELDIDIYNKFGHAKRQMRPPPHHPTPSCHSPPPPFVTPPLSILEVKTRVTDRRTDGQTDGWMDGQTLL